MNVYVYHYSINRFFKVICNKLIFFTCSNQLERERFTNTTLEIKLSLPSGSVYAKKKTMTHPDYVLPEQWESINFLTSWTFLHTGSPHI